MGAPLLKSLDVCAEPVLDRLFRLLLIPSLLNHLHRLSGLVEWNMVARDVFRTGVYGHKVYQVAFVARVGAMEVAEIDAAQRALKSRGLFPRRPHRASISALLNKGEF